MKKILPIVIIVTAAAVGGGGGFFMKMHMEPTSSSTVKNMGEGFEKTVPINEEKARKGNKGKSTKRKNGNSASVDLNAYIKFSRQFVVPIVKNGTPKAMIIMDINLNVSPSLAQSGYIMEPHLRDAFLSKLLIHASNGTLAGIIEESDDLLHVKNDLLETARMVLGEDVYDVLILDVGIQEY